MKENLGHQEEFDTASKPIARHLDHYKKTIDEIRKLLVDYFFDSTRIQKLTEIAKSNEIVFDFNLVKVAMETCLSNERVFEPYSQSLMFNLDHQVINSGLPIQLQAEKNLYSFTQEVPYTPLAQGFMQQFTYALSAYRICLGIYEIYSDLLSSTNRQIQPIKYHLESAQKLRQIVDNEEADLLSLHRQVKGLKKEIWSLLTHQKAHEGMSIFKEDIDKCAEQLQQLMRSGATHLQDSYRLFPNNPWLWMFHDRSWHTMLKTIAKLLYTEQYISQNSDTLTIKEEFIEKIKCQIEEFGVVVSQKIPLLKIELLRQAAKQISESNIDIRAKLAEQGITLSEASQGGVFSTPTIYEVFGRLCNSVPQNTEYSYS